MQFFLRISPIDFRYSPSGKPVQIEHALTAVYKQMVEVSAMMLTRPVHIFPGKLLPWERMCRMQKTFLEKRYTDEMELEDAIHTAILTLKEGFEGQISSKNIEVGVIEADRTFRVLTAAQIEDYLQEVK